MPPGQAVIYIMVVIYIDFIFIELMYCMNHFFLTTFATAGVKSYMYVPYFGT